MAPPHLQDTPKSIGSVQCHFGRFDPLYVDNPFQLLKLPTKQIQVSYQNYFALMVNTHS